MGKQSVIFQVLKILVFILCEASSEKLGIHIATMESWTYAPFGIPWCGAAIDMAVEHITQKYEDTIAFNHTFRTVVSGPSQAGAVAAELYHVDKVDVFIGPGSSSSVEAMAYMVTEWNLPLLSPTGGSGALTDPTLFPILTRISPLNVASYALFYVQLLETYNWRHFVVLHETVGHPSSQWVSLKAELDKTTKYSWTHYELEATFDDEDYEYVLQEANKYARVFILLCSRGGARALALASYRLGFTQGEHAMLTTSYYSTYVPISIWQQNDTFDQIAKKAFQSFVFLTLNNIGSDVFDDFATEVKMRTLRDYGWDHSRYDVSSFAVSYYDSFTIFAQVANETLAAGEDPLDGLAFAQRLRNRTFEGINGRVVIDEFGTRASDLDLRGIDPATGEFRVVGRYQGDLNSYVNEPGAPIVWPNNRGPPPDVPVCGFRNDKCSADADQSVMVATLTAFSLVLAVSGILIFIYVKRWKARAEIDQWWWRIDPKELRMTSFGKTGSGFVSLVSEVSLMSTKTDAPLLDYVTNTAWYKGALVRVQDLPIKNWNLNKDVVAEFKQIRDLNHNNLIRVIGASMDTSPRYLVTELCTKGTLQDLLGNNRIQLDTNFTFSLCIDIAEGMSYLHNSSIQRHGRLSSSTCFIDNRFSVKLTEFGLGCLYGNMEINKDSQEHQRESMWKAPEVLRGVQGQTYPASDVYSYGIILMEILTREAPFTEETDTIGVAGVLEKVTQGGDPPFRPRVDVPEKLCDLETLMKECWAEEPSVRPVFPAIKKTLKKLAARFGASGNLMDSLLRRMEKYANNLEKLVDEKTMELKDEKKKSDELLYQILPRSVAGKLKQGKRVDPEDFDCVTIYFSDICGFTTISARSTPIEVVALLNDLYTCFDAIIDNFDVYKVETIGDAYMVVSGLPQRNGKRHVLEIGRMSLALLKAIETFTIRHLPNEKLRLRIGLHSGPVVAGVVGLKMPRYCLFGDTVNTASRMESHGLELKIHMSDTTNMLMAEGDLFNIEPRGITEIKGKGQMETFWLVGEQKTNNI